MVARDGIEPPTPAFSGPRSTTELSGLGNQAKTPHSGIAKNARAYVCRISLFRGACHQQGTRNSNANQVYQPEAILSNSIPSRYPCSYLTPYIRTLSCSVPPCDSRLLCFSASPPPPTPRQQKSQR